MNKLKLLCTAGLCAMASISTAADFDGSKPLLCATATLTECIPGGVCEQVTSESINAPDFWRIDFKKKTVTVDAPGQEDRPPSKIKSSAIIDEKLFLQVSKTLFEYGGIDDEQFWNMVDDLEKLFLDKKIYYLSIGPHNVCANRQADGRLIPVLVDYKRVGVRTFWHQILLYIPYFIKLKVRRRFRRMREHFRAGRVPDIIQSSSLQAVD